MIVKVGSINSIFQGLFGFFFLFFSSVTVGLAIDLGNIDDGKMIAEEFCSGCHSISKEGDSPFSEAPPFREIVKKWPPESLAEALTEGIVVGHEAMPVFEFGPEVLADFLAYLSTLSDNDEMNETRPENGP